MDVVEIGDVLIPTGWPRAATPSNMRPRWAGEFRDFDDWVNFASARIGVGENHPPAICVDAQGRRCWIGRHFMRARDEGAFPVRYFFECEADHD